MIIINIIIIINVFLTIKCKRKVIIFRLKLFSSSFCWCWCCVRDVDDVIRIVSRRLCWSWEPERFLISLHHVLGQTGVSQTELLPQVGEGLFVTPRTRQFWSWRSKWWSWRVGLVSTLYCIQPDTSDININNDDENIPLDNIMNSETGVAVGDADTALGSVVAGWGHHCTVLHVGVFLCRKLISVVLTSLLPALLEPAKQSLVESWWPTSGDLLENCINSILACHCQYVWRWSMLSVLF